MSEIESFYGELSSLLNIDIDYSQYKEEAMRSIKEALAVIGQHPIAIDYQAVRKPFTLAKTLIEYGFHVGLVMVDDIKPFEKEAYDYLVEHCLSAVSIWSEGKIC